MQVASSIARNNPQILQSKPKFSKPRFSALICNTDNKPGEPPRRCPETGVRIFKYELTNDTSKYPLGRVVCPDSGFPGKNHFLVAVASFCLPVFELIGKEWRLKVMRFLIRKDSKHWEIGPNKPGETQHEILANRGARLLQQSTADVFMKKNGTRVMVMDYDLDKKGKSLTEVMNQKSEKKPEPKLEHTNNEPPKKEAAQSQPNTSPPNSSPAFPATNAQPLSAWDMQAMMIGCSLTAPHLLPVLTQALQHYQQCPQVQPWPANQPQTQIQTITGPLKTERQPSFA